MLYAMVFTLVHLVADSGEPLNQEEDPAYKHSLCTGKPRFVSLTTAHPSESIFCPKCGWSQSKAVPCISYTCDFPPEMSPSLIAIHRGKEQPKLKQKT